MSEIQRLRDRVEELEAEISYLRARLCDETVLPTEWKLTERQGQLFRALLNMRRPTWAAILDFIYGDEADDEPEKKILDVMIYHMRKKLARFGIEIMTDWGRGYHLETESRELALRLIAEFNRTEVEA